jgi:hypothetical protein
MSRPSLLDRAARLAYMFVMLNTCAVLGLVAAVNRRRIW